MTASRRLLYWETSRMHCSGVILAHSTTVFKPVPYAEKQPHTMMFPPPNLTVGMVFLGWCAVPFVLQKHGVYYGIQRVLIRPDYCLPVFHSERSLLSVRPRSKVRFADSQELGKVVQRKNKFIPARHTINSNSTMHERILSKSLQRSTALIMYKHINNDMRYGREGVFLGVKIRVLRGERAYRPWRLSALLIIFF